jgi:hypothetical protein
MSNENLSRRELLKGALIGIAATSTTSLVANTAHAGSPPMLAETDPQAKALGYVADTTKVNAKAAPTHKPTQKCTNCIQFQGKPTDAAGGCNLFPGKHVAGKGWCKVWVYKPGTPAA